mmetsp:Transcript_78962/g.210938  ORF Transcript_78962/g.210938 Transcript_78962/m.210938 type:complete len:103 (-) Transcript_78962:61-369(-)
MRFFAILLAVSLSLRVEVGEHGVVEMVRREAPAKETEDLMSESQLSAEVADVSEAHPTLHPSNGGDHSAKKPSIHGQPLVGMVRPTDDSKPLSTTREPVTLR